VRAYSISGPNMAHPAAAVASEIKIQTNARMTNECPVMSVSLAGERLELGSVFGMARIAGIGVRVIPG
jgi:hypothetical protein